MENRESTVYLKNFGEYFSGSTLRKCSATAAAATGDDGLESSQHQLSTWAWPDGTERRPRKTSLKSKIESLDRSGAGGPIGDPTSKPLDFRSSYSKTGPSLPEQTLEEEEEDTFARTRSSQISDQVEIDSEGDEMHGEGSGEGSDEGFGKGPKSRTGGDPSGLPLSGKKRTKSGRAFGSSTQRNSHFDVPTISTAADDDVGDEDKIRIVRLGDEGDLIDSSEAGLWVKPEPEGPYEPLVLWPPAGEGSSSGNARVVQVPASINSRLFEYQREGVIFLYGLYRKNEGGILADDMGLGKTIQTIAFVAAILDKDSDKDQSLVSIPSSTKVLIQKPKCEKVVLIICPTSVVRNWEQEFCAWGEFQVGVCHGQQRETVLAKVAAKELDVVLTSQDTFRRLKEELCSIGWECVVVDEAHRLKNHNSRFYTAFSKLKTKRRYGLTGTPMQNRLMELFNVFDWATPHCLGDREHFREYYANPIAEGQRISAPRQFKAVSEDRQRHLQVVLSRYHLRRTKQETIGHLMKGKVDNVVFCPLSSVQKSVYQTVLRSPDYMALKQKGLPCSCGSPLTRGECCYRTVPNGFLWPALHINHPDGCDWCPNCLIFPCLTKLRLLSNHLELIKPNPANDQEKQAKDYKFAEMALGPHAGDVGGVEQDQSFMGLSDSQHCGKMAALEALLASWTVQGDKILLFSDSVRMMDILEKFLIRKRYSYSRLDGNTPPLRRVEMVDDFNGSPSKQIFLISTRVGGVGLNLASANRVVIFDPNWNPSNDLQAQDRSFRFGQNRHVTVFRLLAAGSMEELIYTRQIYKQQLFNIAMSGAMEKRYFEGVQGSKTHKGELFGLTNLLRDISEITFAEDIIENHEERLDRMQQKAALEGEHADNHTFLSTEVEDPESEIDHQGSQSQLPGDTMNTDTRHDSTEGDIQGCTHEELRIQKMVHKGLANAGVLYSHRNEDVVNFAAPPVLKAPKRAVERTLQEQKANSKTEEEKTTNRNQTLPQKKARKVTRSHQQSTQREDTRVAKVSKNSKTLTRVTRQVPAAEGKRAMFARLAEFKGMDTTEFSKWILSATPDEKAALPKKIVSL